MIEWNYMGGDRVAEIWGLYDAARKPLGIKHVRGRHLRRGTYHIAVGIWTVNDERKILITLRSDEKKDWPGLWENTAGSVLSGESSRQGAVRELFEETGIKVEEDELVLLGTEITRNAIGDCYIVRKNVDIKDIVLQEGETADARWVTLDELDTMIEKNLIAYPVSKRLAKIRDKFEKFLFATDKV